MLFAINLLEINLVNSCISRQFTNSRILHRPNRNTKAEHIVITGCD